MAQCKINLFLSRVNMEYVKKYVAGPLLYFMDIAITAFFSSQSVIRYTVFFEIKR